MFIIDLILKNNPVPLSVQRKSAEDATALYESLLNVIQGGSSDVFELTCEFQPSKRVNVRVSEISAIQISEKAGTTAAGGRPPGFLATTQS